MQKKLVNIIIGSDHAGFDLKELCKAHLTQMEGTAVNDIGVFCRESADYPRIAHRVAQDVAKNEASRGVLICGTGLGMSIEANRHKGIRAALCHNLYTTRMSRAHNDANILVMGARVIGEGIAIEMLELFLKTPFEGGRHLLRIDQIDKKRGLFWRKKV